MRTGFVATGALQKSSCPSDFACKQPAGTASDLQGASNGAGEKQGAVKAQGYAEEIVVAKITEITSSQEDESM